MNAIGYVAGLLFVVSLADCVENKRLLLMLTGGARFWLIGTRMATGVLSFLIFSFLSGFCSVGAQIMVPLAVHLAP